MIDQPGSHETRSEAQSRELAGLALECAMMARGRLIEGRRRIEGYVARQPMQALGMAFGVGVIVGWLTRRR